MVSALGTGVARASDSYCCNDFDNYLPDPPDPTTTSCNGVCTSTTILGQVTVTCALTANGETPGATVGGMARAVYDDPTDTDHLCWNETTGSYDQYCAWGVDASGGDFWCTWNDHDGDLTRVVVTGSGNSDYVAFFYDATSTAHYDLQDYDGFTGVAFEGRMETASDEDVLWGSRASTLAYVDILKGGSYDDVVCGLAGDDVLYGNAGWDLVCGDDGDDILYGDIGDDHLCGYDGSDSLYGGPGDDFLDYAGGGTSNNGGPDYDRCNVASPSASCEEKWSAPECPTT